MQQALQSDAARGRAKVSVKSSFSFHCAHQVFSFKTANKGQEDNTQRTEKKYKRLQAFHKHCYPHRHSLPSAKAQWNSLLNDVFD